MTPNRRSLLVFVPLLVLSLPVVAPASTVSAQPGPPSRPTYVPPVDAVVVDPFRAPPHAYAPGNRGIEYGTPPGTPVGAAADGLVTFAGPVAGSLHVTVLHADGVRTTYSFLSSVEVTRGASVRQGQRLGHTTGHLHFGARLGDDYIDPAGLFADQLPQVHLVPLELADAPLQGERRGVLGFIGGFAGDQFSRGVGVLRSAPPDLRALAHYSIELRPDVRAAHVAVELTDWWTERDDCTSPSTPASPPDERRIAVLVGGLGTTGTGSSIDALDTEGLGYERDDVIRFSYAGGRVPQDLDGPLAGIEQRDYTKADSEGDLRLEGARLLDLLREVQAREPGVPIDLIAHSQGGVVARTALLDTEAVPESLDTLVTLGSPHSGADLATAVAAIRERPLGPTILTGVEEWRQTGLDFRGVSVGQLAETSDLVAALESAEPPEGVAFRSVGGRGDLVVPDGHAEAPGGRHATVPLWGWTAHTRVASDPAVQREVALAITDRPPTCESLGDAVLDATVAEGISWGEDALGAGVLLASG